MVVGGVSLAAQAPDRAAREAEQAGRWQEAFDSYVKALRSGGLRPDDEIRLRGHVVRLAARLSLSPRMPADAAYASERAHSLMQQAASDAAIRSAQAELERAIRLAPWSGEFAFDLAVLLELRGETQRAIDNFTLYLATDPLDARAVRARIAALDPASKTVAGRAPDTDELARTSLRENRPVADGARTFAPVRLAGVWLSNAVWRLAPAGEGHANAREFWSADKQMSGRILGSWLPLTPAALKATALQNARGAAAGARIVKEAWTRRGGLDVLDLEIELPGGSPTHVLIGQYVTGAPGTVQLTVLAPRDVAASRRGDIRALFSALVVRP